MPLTRWPALLALFVQNPHQSCTIHSYLPYWKAVPVIHHSRGSNLRPQGYSYRLRGAIIYTFYIRISRAIFAWGLFCPPHRPGLSLRGRYVAAIISYNRPCSTINGQYSYSIRFPSESQAGLVTPAISAPISNTLHLIIYHFYYIHLI